MKCFSKTAPGSLLCMVALASGLAFAQLKPGEYPEPNCGSGDDAVKPVALPLQNITIIADTNPPIVSAHKCLSIGFGSNQRKALCVGIGTNLNSTIVTSNRQEKKPVFVCDPARDNPKVPQDHDYKRCLAFRGGLYDSDSEKSTFKKYQNTGDFAGNVPNDGFEAARWRTRFETGEDPFSEFSRGTDQIQFGRDGKLDDYPLILVDRYDFNFGSSVMGLATESVFLKHAVVAKEIPSRAWGFEYGKREETDGELVLGGYNADRFDFSKATEFPVFPNKGIPCPLQVKVKSMSWGNFNAGPFDACIEPTYHTTVLPLDAQKKWNETWIEDYGWSYIGESWEHFDYNNTDLTATLPTNDLTITLENGFTVDIPIINFWNVYRKLDGPTGVYKQTQHKITTRVGNGGWNTSIGESPEVAFLGGPFLSQLYLAVDYEVNKFYLQKLDKPEDRKLQTWREPQNLKVLGCEGHSSRDDQTTGGGETDGKKKLPTWAIAVIVLVAVLAIIGVLLLALFLLKRAHKRRDAAASAALASASNASPSAGGLQVGAPESYGYKNGPPGPVRSETAYSQVSELPYSTPSSPPLSHAPAYSEIYSGGTVSSMGTGTALVGQQANWNGASPNWGSPVPSPGYPVQPTATGYAPVEMPGGEGIAEMGTSAPSGGYSEKK